MVLSSRAIKLNLILDYGAAFLSLLIPYYHNSLKINTRNVIEAENK